MHPSEVEATQPHVAPHAPQSGGSADPGYGPCFPCKDQVASEEACRSQNPGEPSQAVDQHGYFEGEEIPRGAASSIWTKSAGATSHPPDACCCTRAPSCLAQRIEQDAHIWPQKMGRYIAAGLLENALPEACRSPKTHPIIAKSAGWLQALCISPHDQSAEGRRGTHPEEVPTPPMPLQDDEDPLAGGHASACLAGQAHTASCGRGVAPLEHHTKPRQGLPVAASPLASHHGRCYSNSAGVSWKAGPDDVAEAAQGSNLPADHLALPFCQVGMAAPLRSSQKDTGSHVPLAPQEKGPCNEELVRAVHKCLQRFCSAYAHQDGEGQRPYIPACGSRQKVSGSA
mmetsp:Transcript_89841/g.232909  ORF Transcript_89841/g.232909 Transcript_89841/m.232909 type:complete len:342 (-) Transcript_89841:1519-2544(-)